MPARPTLVVASRNAKKRREIEELLAPHNIEVLSVTDFPAVPEVIEDGETFADNAAKKATQTAWHLHRWVLGEDSGLMVDALNGAPGVYSARFSGEGATDEKNNLKLMAELANVPEDCRGARYLSHVAISDPTGTIRLTVEATCRGRILREPRGTNGFGYDPYFLIPEYHLTFGELSSTVKQHLSHRARAFERLILPLVRLLTEA
jgi:XTP/dITP diphosphohydrolase